MYEPILELPFLALGRLVFGSSFIVSDRCASLQPILLTSILCTLILEWVRRITASAIWAYVLAITAAFATLFWPYAYIGLETSQSLFVLLAGFMALSSKGRKGWLHSITFAILSGLAISVKSNGIFLIPAIAFVIFCYCRSVGSKPFEHSSIAPRKVVVIIAIVAALYLVNDHSRSLSATTQSGALGVLKTFGIRNPLFFFVNMYSLTVSINKGLIIYCPPILLALIALHRVHRESPRLAIFAGLALLGLMAGSSLLWCWSDETWGPRYLHAAIAPLLVSFAVTKKAVQFRFRKEIPLLVLVSLGVAVSFVGSLFYYGTLQRVATQTSQATIENFEYNPNWNHIRFNAKLLRLWFRGQTNGHLNEIEPWPPVQTRWYPVGGEGPYVETKQVSLDDYAIPQAMMLQNWPGPHSLRLRLYRASFFVSLLLGSLMLVWAGRRALREDRFISKPYR